MLSRLPFEQEPIVAKEMYNSITEDHSGAAMKRAGLDQGSVTGNTSIFKQHVQNPLQSIATDVHDVVLTDEQKADAQTADTPAEVTRLMKSRLFAADTRAQKLQLLLRGAKVIGNTDTPKEATALAQLVDQLSLDMQAKEHVPTLGASAHAGDDSEPEL